MQVSDQCVIWAHLCLFAKLMSCHVLVLVHALWAFEAWSMPLLQACHSWNLSLNGSLNLAKVITHSNILIWVLGQGPFMHKDGFETVAANFFHQRAALLYMHLLSHMCKSSRLVPSPYWYAICHRQLISVLEDPHHDVITSADDVSFDASKWFMIIWFGLILDRLDQNCSIWSCPYQSINQSISLFTLREGYSYSLKECKTSWSWQYAGSFTVSHYKLRWCQWHLKRACPAQSISILTYTSYWWSPAAVDLNSFTSWTTTQ